MSLQQASHLMDGLPGPQHVLQHVRAHDDVEGVVGQRHGRKVRNDVNVRVAVPRDVLGIFTHTDIYIYIFIYLFIYIYIYE